MEVVGSSPTIPAKNGVIAQLGERLFCIQEVEGNACGDATRWPCHAYGVTIPSDSTKHVGRIRSGRGAGL